MDLKIADVMLQKFKDKNPKLADGVDKDSRALRKLLAQAQKTKAILSSNKVAPFQVESLYMDTDFLTTIKREDFEEMLKETLWGLSAPIDKALTKANLTMSDVTQVEVVGGAWRVPSVQQTLGKFFEEKGSKKMPLGQHLNGEEASALGAALVAANASSSFRTKKIFFEDFTSYEYAVQVAALSGEWEKNITVLYPAGAPLGGKKKLTFASADDFVVRLFEDGVLLSEYVVQGVKELLEGKWKEYNMTGPPKIAASVPLDTSGLIEVKTPTATVEELYWVNTTKPKAKAKPNATDGNSTNGTDNATTEAEDSSESAKATNDSNSSNSSTNETEEVEIVTKQKKRKHEKKLTMKRIDFAPKPLSEERKKELKAKLEVMAEAEAEVLAVAGMKNDLEASIYASRDKLEREDIMKVSTEEQREEVNKLCMEYEEWLYESGATKSDYEQRLSKLQDLLGPMEERATELEARPDVEEQVQDGLSDMKKVHAHIVKNMSWVNPNKTQDALKRLEEFEEWWKKKLELQKKLPLTEAPAYTRKEVIEKLTGLQNEWDKLKKTKKPKEAKKPKDAKNKTAGDDSKDKKTEKKEDLPSDPAEVEKLLASLREEKAAAVAAEDFDKAQSLKSREATLTKQLEKLKDEL